MTSPLLAVFVDASEKERKTLYSASGCDGICVIDNDGKQVGPLFDWHFDAERFIAERATVAGMRAVREALGPVHHERAGTSQRAYRRRRMTTPELQRAARAIARLNVSGMTQRAHDLWVDTHWEEFIPHARACFESVLPVGDAVVEAGRMASDHAREIRNRTGESTDPVAEAITAAIRHITTGGDDAV